MQSLINQNRIRALQEDLKNPAHSEQERKALQRQIDFLQGKKKTSVHSMSAQAMSSGVSFKGAGTTTLTLFTDPNYSDTITRVPKPGEKDKKGNPKKTSVLNKTRGIPMAPFYEMASTSSAIVCNNFEGVILVSPLFKGKRLWTIVTPESTVYNSVWGDALPRSGWISKKNIEYRAYQGRNGIGASIDQPPKCIVPLDAPHDMRDIWEVLSTHRTPTHLYPMKHLPTQDDAHIYYRAPADDGADAEDDDASSSSTRINTKAMNAALRIACRNMMSVDHPMYPQAAERSGVLHPLYSVNGYQRVTGEEVMQHEPQLGGALATEGAAAPFGSPFLCNPTKQWMKNNENHGWDEKTMPIPRCDFVQQVTFSDPNQQNEDGESKVTNIMLVTGTIWAEQLEALGVTNPNHVAAFYPDLIKSALPFVRGEVDMTRTTGLETNTDAGAQWQDDVRCYGVSIKSYELFVDWVQMLCSACFEISQYNAYHVMCKFLSDLGMAVDEDEPTVSTDVISSESEDPIVKHLAYQIAHGRFSNITGGNVVNAFESKTTFSRPNQVDKEHKQNRFFLLTNATLQDAELLGEIRQLYYDYYLAASVPKAKELEERLCKMAVRVSGLFVDSMEGKSDAFRIPENHQYTVFQVKRSYINQSGARERDFSFLGSRPVAPPSSDTSKRAELIRERIKKAARKPSEILESLGLLTATQRNNIDMAAFMDDMDTSSGSSGAADTPQMTPTTTFNAPQATTMEDDDSPYAGFNVSIGKPEAASSSDSSTKSVKQDESDNEDEEEIESVNDIEDDDGDESDTTKPLVIKTSVTKPSTTKIKKKTTKAVSSAKSSDAKGKSKRKRDSSAASAKRTGKKQK